MNDNTERQDPSTISKPTPECDEAPLYEIVATDALTTPAPDDPEGYGLTNSCGNASCTGNKGC